MKVKQAENMVPDVWQRSWLIKIQCASGIGTSQHVPPEVIVKMLNLSPLPAFKSVQLLDVIDFADGTALNIKTNSKNNAAEEVREGLPQHKSKAHKHKMSYCFCWWKQINSCELFISWINWLEIKLLLIQKFLHFEAFV